MVAGKVLGNPELPAECVYSRVASSVYYSYVGSVFTLVYPYLSLQKMYTIFLKSEGTILW